MYAAFVEMRAEAYEKQKAKIFHIADIFHTVPLQLERANKGEMTYEEVYSAIKNKAAEKGCEQLLESLIKNASA
jgi:HD-GYP domain-containing protein (c-di-GMP phosphodiesterase class II)